MQKLTKAILGLSLALAGCCGRTLSVARPVAVKCPVVVVQSEVEPQVIAMVFVSMTRHVHVDSLLYLSGLDVLPKLKLYDYNGCPPFRNSCKIVKGGRSFLSDIEQRCNMEVSESERDDQVVWATFYRSDMIPQSYPVSFELYKGLVADLRTSIDNNVSIDDCQGIEYPVGCRWFDDIKCLGTDVTAVPDMSVLLSAYDGTGYSPACVFYRGEVNNPVKCSDWAFFRLWTERVKLKEEITMDEFRKEVESKMSECAKRYASDFQWEFRLVCWDAVSNKSDSAGGPRPAAASERSR